MSTESSSGAPKEGHYGDFMGLNIVFLSLVDIIVKL